MNGAHRQPHHNQHTHYPSSARYSAPPPPQPYGGHGEQHLRPPEVDPQAPRRPQVLYQAVPIREAGAVSVGINGTGFCAPVDSDPHSRSSSCSSCGGGEALFAVFLLLWAVTVGLLAIVYESNTPRLAAFIAAGALHVNGVTARFAKSWAFAAIMDCILLGVDTTMLAFRVLWWMRSDTSDLLLGIQIATLVVSVVRCLAMVVSRFKWTDAHDN